MAIDNQLDPPINTSVTPWEVRILIEGEMGLAVLIRCGMAWWVGIHVEMGTHGLNLFGVVPPRSKFKHRSGTILWASSCMIKRISQPESSVWLLMRPGVLSSAFAVFEVLSKAYSTIIHGHSTVLGHDHSK